MRLTIAVRLRPTQEQADALRATTERANAACNALSRIAWEARTFGQYGLHKLAYAGVRASSGLSAQVVVRAIAKVADAYKRDTKRQRTFRPLGAIAYDRRILRWSSTAVKDKYAGEVSIWTVAGRARIPFVCGERARALLPRQQGESDLVSRDGTWFLCTTVTVEEPPAGEPRGFLGVDLGIVHLAADSDGTTYSGAVLNGLRVRHERLRKRLQAKGTKGSRRFRSKRRRKQARFQRHTNHTIAKRLVAVAQGTARGIALEELRGIRQRVTVRKRERSRHGNWANAQLRAFVAYKARLAGVPLVLVDPRNTSRECPTCGHVARENRPHRDIFLCVSCGLSGPADTIAALNIQRRAACKPASCSDTATRTVAPGHSSRL